MGTLIYEQRDWIDRKECAAYLNALGVPISASRLASLAVNNNAGKGPPFYKVNTWNRVRYRPIEVADWAKARLVRVP